MAGVEISNLSHSYSEGVLNQDIAVGGGNSDAIRDASNSSAVTSSEIKQSQSCEDVIGSSQDDLTRSGHYLNFLPVSVCFMQKKSLTCLEGKLNQ